MSADRLDQDNPAPGSVDVEAMQLALLTSLTPQHVTYLRAAARSVRALARLLGPAGHDLRWLVVADWHLEVEEERVIRQILRFGSGELLMLSQRGGPGTARSAALRAAIGADAILPFDADDVLAPAGVMAMLAALATDPTLEWVAARRTMIGGGRTPERIRARAFAPGDLEELWREPFLFHPNLVMARRSAALAVRGWGDDPAHNLGWVLALSAEFRGRLLAVTALRYRRWPGQSTAQPDYAERRARAEAEIALRVNWRRRRRGLEPITPPLRPSGSTSS
jgi:hypothetical protein